jgi:hypothetical protein
MFVPDPFPEEMLNDIISQPIEGLLYDLNLLPECNLNKDRLIDLKMQVIINMHKRLYPIE